MEESIARGKKKIIIIIAVFIGFDILSSLINIFAFGLEDISKKIIRFAILGLLCLFLYKRQKWAKILITLCLVIGMITAVIYFIKYILPLPAVGIFSALLFALYLRITMLLASNADVNNYFEWSDSYKKRDTKENKETIN